MEKFLYLFRGGNNGVSPSPEVAQVQLQKWGQWMQMLTKNGIMLAGEPLQRTGKQVNGKGKVVTDGPFVEAKEMVGGYLVINAKNLDEAVEIAKGCPIFENDGKVEVRPFMKMEEM